MKKLITLLIFFCSISLYSISQTFVSTDTLPRNAVLEEFTGINCQYCPDGHTRAQAISDQNPGRVVLVNIHQGLYAQPSSGQPDYRTPFGDSLAEQALVPGYPAGTVNRHIFAGLSEGGGTTMGRGKWAAAVPQILPLTSPLNVGINTSFNSGTRELTVTVELYYTANSNTPVNRINVALLENHVIGPQNILGTMNLSYDHKHMLRNFLTGQWGDTVSHTTSGSFISRTYSYIVPAGYNIDNCDVAAYVAESHQEIITGTQVKANGGNTLQIGILSKPAPEIDEGTPNDTTFFYMNTSSSLAGNEDFVYELKNNAPADWEAYLEIGGITYPDSATITLPFSVSTPVKIKAYPGNTPAIATYELTMRSVSNPDSPIKSQKMMLISNITDIVLNNDEAWGDGDTVYSTAKFQSNYLKGLALAGNTHYAAAKCSDFVKVALAGKAENVHHLYFNVGWSFPSLTKEKVQVFKEFMDNGGNFMISGQDIGWDTWDTVNGGNGNSVTQAFYKKYMKAKFINDGGTANNSIKNYGLDLVYGTLGTSSLVNVYGGAYFYPDQIDTTGDGLRVFYYDNAFTKIGAVRNPGNDYKSAYFGFSLEQVSDTVIRKTLIQLTHDWFHGMIGAEEYDNMVNAILGQNYPNPATSFTYIPVNGCDANDILRIYDINGRLIKEINLTGKTDILNLNVSEMENGIYLYRIIGKNRISETYKLQVIR